MSTSMMQGIKERLNWKIQCKNQNFWNDPYTTSEYSGRHLIGENDEFGNSYSLNPESQPEESLNELFTFSHSNTITSGSVSNMTSVLDSSTVSVVLGQKFVPVKDDVNVVSSSNCLKINTDSNVISLNNDALKNDMASKDSQEMILITDSIPKVNDADLISDTHNLAVDIDSKEGNLISINSNNVSERTIHENVLVPGSEIMFKAATYENDTNQNIGSRTELAANSFFDHINIKDDPNCVVDDADVLYSIRQEHTDDVAFDFDTDKLISLDTNISTETSGGTYVVMSEGDVENFEILKSKLNNGDIVYNQSTSSEIYKEGVQNLTNKEDISSVLNGDLKSLPANCYLENKDDSHCNATYLEKQINLNMPIDTCKLNPEMTSEVNKSY
ncbi:hypothetical protein CEXT_815491 [Caerostris extrusa]|uniref:Uncharacterized protein n=1 Tax=Caerostris extrusa TaxID=172846 RepID=A0AAV4PTS6_CAEEX|nr:hypothetical protein CEXT_815491 [Caerostris extrusa]